MKKKPTTEQDEFGFRRGELEHILSAARQLTSRQYIKQAPCPRCGYEPTRLDRVLRRTPHQLLQDARQRPLPPGLRYLTTPARLQGDGPDYLSTVLGSLHAGYVDRFFDALVRWPEILQDPDVWKLTIGKWHKQKIFSTPEGKQARDYLRKIGSMLADPRGRPELSTREQRQQNKQMSTRQSKRRSDAALRLEVKRLEMAAIRERQRGTLPVACPQARNSTQAATRKAARLVQEKIEKGKL